MHVVKAQLKREGKESSASLVELQSQHRALQQQAEAAAKVCCLPKLLFSPLPVCVFGV